jgi:hypothetical protein
MMKGYCRFKDGGNRLLLRSYVDLNPKVLPPLFLALYGREC